MLRLRNSEEDMCPTCRAASIGSQTINRSRVLRTATEKRLENKVCTTASAFSELASRAHNPLKPPPPQLPGAGRARSCRPARTSRARSPLRPGPSPSQACSSRADTDAEAALGTAKAREKGGQRADVNGRRRFGRHRGKCNSRPHRRSYRIPGGSRRRRESMRRCFALASPGSARRSSRGRPCQVCPWRKQSQLLAK